MMNHTFGVGVVLVALVSLSCGSGGGQALAFKTVEDVVTAFDKHTLNEGERIDKLVGSYDGDKFDVEPGGYQIEIHVYRAKGNIPSLDSLETADNQVVVEDNILLILHDTDSTKLERILEDLRD